MSKLARARALAAMLAALGLAGMTAAAQAHDTDRAVRRPRTENRIEKAWRQRRVTAQQPPTADATRAALAQERY